MKTIDNVVVTIQRACGPEVVGDTERIHIVANAHDAALIAEQIRSLVSEHDRVELSGKVTTPDVSIDGVG